MTVIDVAEVGCFVPAHGHLYATHLYMLNVRRSIVRDEQVVINRPRAISQSKMNAATSKAAVYVTSICRVGVCRVLVLRRRARDTHGHITRASTHPVAHLREKSKQVLNSSTKLSL